MPRKQRSNGKPQRSKRRATPLPPPPASELDLAPATLPAQKLTKTLQVARRQTILRSYTAGKTPEQISFEMKLPPMTVEREINAALDQVVRYYAESKPQHTFVRYAVFQMGIVHKLQRAYEAAMHAARFMEQPNYTPAISALRAQSDVYDKVLDRGISMHVIDDQTANPDHLRKAPDDLRQELKSQITTLTILLERVEESTTPLSPTKQLHPNRIIKKVRRNHLGFVFRVHDWRLPKPRATKLREQRKSNPQKPTHPPQQPLTLEQELTHRIKNPIPKPTKKKPTKNPKQPLTPYQKEKQSAQYLIPPK